jgi:hypothetical protein
MKGKELCVRAYILELGLYQMTHGIQRTYPPIKPSLVRFDDETRFSIGVIGLMILIQRVQCHRESSVDGIRPAVCPDGVPLSQLRGAVGTYDRASELGRTGVPVQRDRVGR